jgi:2-polyprenyl-6-methoxyphenol hydroxylase-like FAD-dependent oxidoreductase
MRRIGEHAVVLGAGMSGLLAARVLAEAYERVTIVERDESPPAGQARRGVPQGRHAHALLPRGQRLVDELFPGLADEMIADGAVAADPGTEHRFILGGHALRKVPSEDRALTMTRPFLEGHMRERIRALPGVTFAEGCDVVGLTAISERITGARIMRRAVGSAEEELAADLVVDAMGRGGRTAVWLAALGYDRAPEEEIQVGVAYASRFLRLPPDAIGEKAVVVGPRPGLARGMGLLAVEGDRWLLTLAGLSNGHRPPTDPDGFLTFAATVAPPHVLSAIQRAEPLGAIATHRYPSDLRRHYERLRRLPEGLIVTGDALCSFNPIYAQGMTVAALEAAALRRCLDGAPDGLARRYYRAAAKALNDPWRMAVAADLSMPEVEGRRSPAIRLLNAYVDRVQATAEHDAAVAGQFTRVIGLLDPPSRLMRPSIVTRTLLRAGAGTTPTDVAEVTPAEGRAALR